MGHTNHPIKQNQLQEGSFTQRHLAELRAWKKPDLHVAVPKKLPKPSNRKRWALSWLVYLGCRK